MHHLCIFHAMQDAQQPIQDVYGLDYAEEHPAAEQLKQQIYAIVDAETPALVAERYVAVRARRQDYTQPRPEAAAIFDFLVRRWPKLVNGVGASLIPATNRAPNP